ncbi:toprim domain-containing protein [Candidatus Woesearchaeota archaeon]|nr:toprim domain-containing protein [Candidatus Woesearchaeota archaeon]
MEIEELIAMLEKAVHEDLLFIVEGMKDKASLEALGVGNLITLHGRPLFEVVESVSSKRVIVLTDLDAEGKKLYSFIAKELSRRGVIVDNTIRNWLFRNTALRHVEGLASYVNGMRGRQMR